MGQTASIRRFGKYCNDEVKKGYIPELGLSCPLIWIVALLVYLTLFYFGSGFIEVFTAGQLHI